jgi:hypothetical protein
MDEYSFSNHVNSRLGEFLAQHNFSLNTSASKLAPGFEFNLLRFKSPQCQLQVYLEHDRIYTAISALGVKNPNLWYNVDVMACFVSGTPPYEWFYDLPRGVPLRQVMEEQLTRWQTILERHFDQILPLFVSLEKLNELTTTLNPFVRSFYAERQQDILQKRNTKQDKNA